jgi:hypothetical protein
LAVFGRPGFKFEIAHTLLLVLDWVCQVVVQI